MGQVRVAGAPAPSTEGGVVQEEQGEEVVVCVRACVRVSLSRSLCAELMDLR
jgi:formaldehyde-activating enzyme involved in methanogenesis